MQKTNKRSNLIGKKFGKILVIKISNKKKNRGFLWECLCECGKTCYDTTQNLKTGHRISCGCSRKDRTNLIGLKSNMLTVVEYAGTRSYDKTHSERRWKCLCECGKYTNLSTAILTKNKVMSCGCVKNINGKENRFWKGFEDISGVFWLRILRNAKARNSDIDFNMEFLWDLYIKQNRKCKLSGIEIHFNKKNGITASLDRIDSSKGYTKDNIQWVHKDINRMKTDFPQDYFLDLCSSVANTSCES
jgi:hypothetical protein